MVVTSPAGLGPLLGDQSPLLLHVTRHAPGELDLLLAASDGSGQQDLCIETTPLLGADFTTDPDLSWGPGDLALEVDGLSLSGESFSLRGTFGPGRADLGRVQVEAVIDTVPVVPLVTPGGGDEAVCDLLALLGIGCIPCPSGASAYCLPYRAEDVVGAEVLFPLVPRTPADIAADPACP